MKSIRNTLISLGLGGCIPLGLSPFNLWYFTFCAMTGSFLLQRTARPQTALYHGFLFGIGLFGVGTSWIYISIHQFGSESVLLSLLLTSLFIVMLSLFFVAPCLWLFARIRQQWHLVSPLQQSLLFSALWVLFEWSRVWFLTGFPWALIGYSLLDTPIRALAPITGVYGLSFFLVLSATTFACCFCLPKTRLFFVSLQVSVIITIWLAAFQLSKIRWTTVQGTLTVSAIQGNISQHQKWDASYIKRILNIYFRLSQNEWGRNIIVWPENAIPIVKSAAHTILLQLANIAHKNKTLLITGLPTDKTQNNQTRYYNSLIALGSHSGEYDKQKLVPFGEYIPFDFLLRGLITFFDLPMSNFTAGSIGQAPLKAGKILISPAICYELAYPSFIAHKSIGTHLLLSVSNDSWFGRSIASAQHFQMARMRSLETERAQVTATNDGITALIDRHGYVIKQLSPHISGVLRGHINWVQGNTPFMILRSWPIVFLCIFIILTIRLTSKRKLNKKN